MESKNNIESLPKQGSFTLENSKKALVKNFNANKSSIPDWKSFDIKDIAEIRLGSNNKIVLKDVKEDGNGKKFIEINGRKYYEFNGKGTPKSSFYIYKGSALFLGDKVGGSLIWDGVSFRCLHEGMDSFLFEQRKTRYLGGAMHLQQIYKSEIFPSGNSVMTVNKKGKSVKITKNLVEKYLDGSISDSSRHMIEDAIKSDPEFFEYIENLNR